MILLFKPFSLSIKNIMMALFLGVITLLFLQPAKALTCNFTNLFSENISIPMPHEGYGTTVGEDAPIGKVIHSQDYWAVMRSTSYECTTTIEDMLTGNNAPMNTYTRTEVISTPFGPAINFNGKDVFPTGIPGIGAIFYISGPTMDISQFPNTWEFTTYPLAPGTVTQGLGQFSRVKIELIKTGVIPAGTFHIYDSALPTFQVVSGSNSPFVENHVFVTLNFSGDKMVDARTCQLATSNIEANLGNHWLARFNGPGPGPGPGPGSVTEWKDFDIVLKDCPPFIEYNYTTYMEEYNYTLVNREDNRVDIGFRSSYGTVEGNPLLAKIIDGPNAARGMGIELSHRRSSDSIPLDGSGGFLLSDFPMEHDSNYVIPLKARYVKTDSNVEAGLANGAVVFTIFYH